MLLTSSSIRQSARCGDTGEELPLGERGIAERDVARDILEQNPPPENVLHLAHARGDVLERSLGVGQRQEIMGVPAGDPGPAQVIGDPLRLHARGQRRDLPEVLAIEGRAAADRERHAVHRHRVALADTHQVVERLAARHQVVLGQHLEPVDRRSIGEHRLVVLDTQAEAEAERGTGEHVVDFPREPLIVARESYSRPRNTLLDCAPRAPGMRQA